jgi:hypothetical protein
MVTERREKRGCLTFIAVRFLVAAEGAQISRARAV